jgi:HNH endonuclease
VGSDITSISKNPSGSKIVVARDSALPEGTFSEGFAENVAPPDENGCRVWTGKLNKNGYGSQQEHRRAWELAHGPIPDGLHIHHECGNKACVNVEHLRAVTPEEHPRLSPRIRQKKERPPLPRLAYRFADAAEVLSVSEDFFSEHIAPHLRIVRVGRCKLVSVTELQKWVDSNEALTLGELD